MNVADLLAVQQARGGSPALTWYGPGRERVELSGAVLVNWVNKTVNLLVTEFSCGPGTVVLLALPSHWRTVVWALAVWRCGGAVVFSSDDSPTVGGIDVVVTDMPEAYPDAAGLVVVTLDAFARKYPGKLPVGAIDAASDVMTYPDELGPVDGRGAAVAAGPAERQLIVADEDVRAVVTTATSLLAGGGSVVLCTPRSDASRIVVSEQIDPGAIPAE